MNRGDRRLGGWGNRPIGLCERTRSVADRTPLLIVELLEDRVLLSQGVLVPPTVLTSSVPGSIFATSVAAEVASLSTSQRLPVSAISIAQPLLAQPIATETGQPTLALSSATMGKVVATPIDQALYGPISGAPLSAKVSPPSPLNVTPIIAPVSTLPDPFGVITAPKSVTRVSRPSLPSTPIAGRPAAGTVSVSPKIARGVSAPPIHGCEIRADGFEQLHPVLDGWRSGEWR